MEAVVVRCRTGNPRQREFLGADRRPDGRSSPPSRRGDTESDHDRCRHRCRRPHRAGFVSDVQGSSTTHHLPANLVRQFTKPTPVPAHGGQRALDRRIVVEIRTEFGPASVPLPDLVGALVIKARAAASDTRDRDRHHTDLAQLVSLIDDPLATRSQLDKKETRYLRQARLSNDPTTSPWIGLNEESRQRTIDAWLILTES